MFKGDYLFTSEAVIEGHPDKICGQISDAVLDEVLRQDPKGRVVIETLVTLRLVVIAGETKSTADINVEKTAKKMLKEISYSKQEFGFDCNNFSILNSITNQSTEIARGVDKGDAGDQGIMFGYATNETNELMFAPILWANRLAKYLSEARKTGLVEHLGPDGKTQLTFRYIKERPANITKVVLSTQHTEDVLDNYGNISEEFKNEIKSKISKKYFIKIGGKNA